MEISIFEEIKMEIYKAAEAEGDYLRIPFVEIETYRKEFKNGK